jgi:hypothetical protein
MKKIIKLTESELINIIKKIITEQDDVKYKKENDFLKKYIGKTFNVYNDKNFKSLHSGGHKIISIKYDGGGIMINTNTPLFNVFYMECQHNPDKLSYGFNNNDSYNKTLVDDINQKGTSVGIKWCQLHKADFSTKDSYKSLNNFV